ncbi:MAG: DUF5103 domain-containing protein [Bacteroidetes bacterium]|nr:DUF5103 domain-containing protein [Bacteroidota bacterium]MBU1717779.1 DUF5103 domain-containing protein [Bacteroidota bacterium]
MKKKIHIFLVVLSAFLQFGYANAQKKDRNKQNNQEESAVADEYYSANFLRYSDYVYSPDIHTVQLFKKGWELSAPIIVLNSDEQLELHFDQFGEDRKDYSWTVIQCNADWKPSVLQPHEYLETFTEDVLTDYDFSFNTLQKYVHYSLTFPNENIKISKSGNFLLIVYPPGEPDSPVLSRRFLILEESVTIEVNLRQATTPANRLTHQEVDFVLKPGAVRITNPYDALKVVLVQNNCWENAITGLTPVHIREGELDYDYNGENAFPGYKEYRWFDTRSLRMLTDQIEKYDFADGKNIVDLKVDVTRTDKNHYSYSDLNGKFAIRNKEGLGDHLIEADYTLVNFRLFSPLPITFGSVFISGALTGWGFPKDAKMNYNYSTKCYECQLLLKQGYYSYMYLISAEKVSDSDTWYFEGSSSETENEYQIFVYYREDGTLYDKLIGYQKANSVID